MLERFMPTVFLAHSNPNLRTQLTNELGSRGFMVQGHADIESALDAAGESPPLALLVEPSLLDGEDFEVSTRLELRAGRAVPIFALTHKATPEQMKTLRRHGAGLLSRPIEDIDRLATQLRIQSEAAAPEAPAPEVAPSRGRGKSGGDILEIRETVGTPGGRRKRKRGAAVPEPEPELPLPDPEPSATATPAPAAEHAPRYSESPVFSLPVPAAGSILPFDAIPEASSPAPRAPIIASLPPFVAPPLVAPPPPALAPPPPSAEVATSILPPDAIPAANRTDVYFAGEAAPPPSKSSDDYFSRAWDSGASPSTASPLPAPPAPPAPAAVTQSLPVENLFTPMFAPQHEAPAPEGARPVSAAEMLASLDDPPEVPRPPAPRRPIPTGPDLMFEDEYEEPTTGFDDRFADKESEATTVQDVAAVRETSIPGVQQHSGGEGPSVLVVDDEPAFRGFLRDALAAKGYRVHTAINAPNALRFLKGDNPIDLVISDLNMPHMDGFELKHEIDRWMNRKMPFIVVTADTSAEKIEIASQVGAAAIVPKPIEDLDAFYAIVKDTLIDAGVDLRGLAKI